LWGGLLHFLLILVVIGGLLLLLVVGAGALALARSFRLLHPVSPRLDPLGQNPPPIRAIIHLLHTVIINVLQVGILGLIPEFRSEDLGLHHKLALRQFALKPGLLGHGFLELGTLVVIAIVLSVVLVVFVLIF
jgi:hypothetical protein